MQVFGVFMHLKHAAAARVDAEEQMNSKAEVAVNKLTELCAAAEAVSDTDLLQLGLPVMRSVSWLKRCYRCASLQSGETAPSPCLQLALTFNRHCPTVTDVFCLILIVAMLQTSVHDWRALAQVSLAVSHAAGVGSCSIHRFTANTAGESKRSAMQARSIA